LMTLTLRPPPHRKKRQPTFPRCAKSRALSENRNPRPPWCNVAPGCWMEASFNESTQSHTRVYRPTGLLCRIRQSLNQRHRHLHFHKAQSTKAPSTLYALS
jgi:hypothetical protein